MNVHPPKLPPDLVNLSLEQLVELIETQQRSITFLLREYDRILAQVEASQSGLWQFANPISGLNMNVAVPQGQYLAVAHNLPPETPLLRFYPPPEPLPAPLPGVAADYAELGFGLVISDGTRLRVAHADLLLLPVRQVRTTQ